MPAWSPNSTTGGARAIAENFEAIRVNAEEERKRTSDAMRTVYEQSTNESHAMLAEAAERFAEVVGGLKQMTAEMQEELEATRQELRKGILELPQETAESAAQMRRVIVDQIEALAELNRIVARHGRNLDAVEPAAMAPRRIETIDATLPQPRRVMRDEPALTNGGARLPEPPRPRVRHHRFRGHASARPAGPPGAGSAGRGPSPKPGRQRARRMAVRYPHPRIARGSRGAPARGTSPVALRVRPRSRRAPSAQSIRSIRSRSTSPA